MIILTIAVLAATTLDVVVASGGVATYYGGNVNGNACGFNSMGTSSFPYGFGAAIGSDNFDDGYGCGKCFQITCLGPDGDNPSCFCNSDHPTVTVWANDQCPECDNTHIDLNTEAMEYIVADGLAGTCGRIEIEIEQVNCDFPDTIQIRSKTGTSAYWYGLHVDNVDGHGAISEVWLKSDGSSSYDIECTKSQSASFWLCDQSMTPYSFPMSVQLTDDGGRTLTGEDVIQNADAEATWDFGDNFGDASSFESPGGTDNGGDDDDGDGDGDGGAGPPCLSGYSTVTVLRDNNDESQVEEIYLKGLEIGDKILVDASANKFEEVYAFGHRNVFEEAVFLQIETASGKAPLEITGEHLLYKKKEEVSSSVEASIPVRADSIQVGDYVVRSSKKGEEADLVTKITPVTQIGLYSPLTKQGFFVANGLKVSSYTAAQDKDPQYLKVGSFDVFSHHFVSHVGAAPLRILCDSRFGGGSNHFAGIVCHERNEQGRLHFLELVEKGARWGMQLNSIVFGVLFGALAMVFLPLFGVEKLHQTCGCASPFVCCILFCVASVVYFNSRRQTQAK